MNINQARGGDDDYGAVGAEPTMPARYAGTCGTCGRRFAVGDPIASVLVDKRMTYHHGRCRYPATALLQQEVAEADDDAVLAAQTLPKAGICRATTNKGKPCRNRAMNGSNFCGPHHDQLVTRVAGPTSPTGEPDPHDAPF